jgi:hypothetical protein
MALPSAVVIPTLSASATLAAPGRHRPRLVDGYRPAEEFLTVQSLHCGFCACAVGEFHKAESPLPVRFFVDGKFNGPDGSEGLEMLLQIEFVRLKTEISDE